MRGGSKAFIKYTHRYYAEFAREAMMDQMNVFEGQKEPLLIKWGIDGSGNPLETKHEDKSEANLLEKRKRYEALQSASGQDYMQ